LRVRREMGVFANLRPVKVFPALAGSSPCARRSSATSISSSCASSMAASISASRAASRPCPTASAAAFNTQTYTTSEIRRIGVVAFELARQRQRRVTSVDKANCDGERATVREEMQKLRDESYPEIALNHLYVDNCAMQIIRAPRQFDVMVTDNIFGDILSDCASMISGSLGMLPSPR